MPGSMPWEEPQAGDRGGGRPGRDGRGRWPTTCGSPTAWRSSTTTTLVVAESHADRLTAWTITDAGALADRRVWADLGEGAAPDGICVDAEGAIWYATVPGQRCVRVAEGGEVLQTVDADRGCFACMLGGDDGRTLYIVANRYATARAHPTASCSPQRVDVPHAGRP